VTQLQQNLYIFFLFSGFWNLEVTRIASFADVSKCKRAPSRKKTVKKSHTIRTEPATWIKKKDYLNFPFFAFLIVQDAAVLLPNKTAQLRSY